MILGPFTDSSNRSEPNLQVFLVPTLKLLMVALFPLMLKGHQYPVLNQFASVFNSEGHFSSPTVQSPFPDMPAFQVTTPGVEKILLGVNVKKIHRT